MTLLHVLLELQRRSPVKFTVSAATVNPETPEFSPEPLIVPWIFFVIHGGFNRKDQLGPLVMHHLSQPTINFQGICLMFKGVMIIYLGGGFKSIIFGIFTPENLGKFDPILGKNLNLDLFFR